MSGNRYKIDEVTKILDALGITVIPLDVKIQELQTKDVQILVRDKVLKAFDRIGRPLFVEHTGLYLDKLNGFPGGLTQVFWDTLQADRFAKLFGTIRTNAIEARTIIGYCDGRLIEFFEGSIRGRVPEEPRGPSRFQWDCVFVPDGHTETFAEMGDLKNEISMRKLALEKFAAYLTKGAK